MSVKLSARVKQLLTLRNPNPSPAPNLVKLRAVFDATSNAARLHKAERGWLALATATLLSTNSPDSVAHLYRYASKSKDNLLDLPERVNTAAFMRESALKSSIFVGVAMTINSLAALHGAMESDVKEHLRKDPLRDANRDNINTFLARGHALWKSIYEPHADKLQNKLGSYHPDFPLFILQAYGVVLAPLSPSEQGNVNRALTSVVGISCLRAMQGVGPQLISHVFGLLKARGVEGESEGDRWLSSDEGTVWVIETVDKICDVVRENDASDSVQAKL
ncbi:hypothetical protein SISSUDRAFT_985639 [Sistotremastrum suecicum HHB10207 ss-3]|uniref:Dol-P-Man:Man(5)GlcNAc(2)-PP-Dol alpha-1,3-mannosyltransferase n=1 Tax=Sistotremastrum suecicum HHB10207 ss-3 TaxID=1314776 RepID=A0A166DWH1_9AGAM|nr:hypothetical protein SISSUDRAFT_985639 [Sistotremastrum suecicum HHB10207 ss-3]